MGSIYAVILLFVKREILVSFLPQRVQSSSSLMWGNENKRRWALVMKLTTLRIVKTIEKSGIEQEQEQEQEALWLSFPLFPSMTMIASRSETWLTRRQWQWRFRFIRSEPLSSEFLWAGTSNAQRCGEKDLYFWNPYEDMFMMVQTFFQKWTEMKFVYSLLVFLKKKHSKIVI